MYCILINFSAGAALSKGLNGKENEDLDDSVFATTTAPVSTTEAPDSFQAESFIGGMVVMLVLVLTLLLVMHCVRKYRSDAEERQYLL